MSASAVVSRRFSAAIVLAVALWTTTAARAEAFEERALRYEAPAAAVAAWGIEDPSGSSSDGSLDVGAVRFPALGGEGWAGVALTVTDDVAPFITFNVCQGFGKYSEAACHVREPHRGFRDSPDCVPNGSTVVVGVDRELPIWVQVGPGVCGGPGITYSLIPIPTYEHPRAGAATAGTVFLGHCSEPGCAD